MAASPQFVTTPNNQFTKLLPATVPPTTVWSSTAASGGIVRGICLALHAAADNDVMLVVLRGGTAYDMCSATVPARPTVGIDPTVPVLNLLDPTYIPFIDHEPSRALYMQEGDELQIVTANVLAAGESLDVTVWGGDY